MTLPGWAVLRVHPTRRRNLRCLHYYSSSGPHVAETTGPPVLQQAVADAAVLGYDVLGVSGGEPMLYRPLDDLLRTARSHGMRTTVTSNGMLLTGRRLSELAGLVDVLAISLDGVPDSHVRMRQDPRSFAVMERRLPLEGQRDGSPARRGARPTLVVAGRRLTTPTTRPTLDRPHQPNHRRHALTAVPSV
ncbi:radical SAM protein [Kitasatospora sp. NPDC048286]|uniref:radical SAM protein n=1 Tax=Kitasatospora sp. NPDC048286 TaxID=3364047 RepID=UPI003715110E